MLSMETAVSKLAFFVSLSRLYLKCLSDNKL